MAVLKTTKQAWAVKWQNSNQLDGYRVWFDGTPEPPTVVLFTSRSRARDYVKERYGYIADRADLRGEPHGWRVPKVVRVSVTVTERR